jgi:muramoyltetrapeptide carboxypeptidase LdcA involved in peptidoglycan recycling
MIEIPPYLKPGDTIGIVCPAGYMTMEKVQTCIQTLESGQKYCQTPQQTPSPKTARKTKKTHAGDLNHSQAG